MLTIWELNSHFVNLENPDTRQFAMEDPRGFLGQFPKGAILDEVQIVPCVFSYLQQILYESKVPGLFILTGFNNFLLQANISQGLAGRIVYIVLLPFSLRELSGTGNRNLDECLFRGMSPPVYDQPVEVNNWYLNYVRIEIKSGKTSTSGFFAGLDFWRKISCQNNKETLERCD
ncbi:MAG: AAA family ATPase [Bacteroidales bacterium]|nr:AAA family ATPase [Bacteroidales bacterium]